MSLENIEVVRRGYEAFNRSDLDGMVADFARTFEYIASGAVPGTGGVYRGPEGLKQFMGWFGEFSGARAEINELIDAGGQVLVGITARGRGKQSGVESGWRLWHVWTLRHGKIVHGQGFTDRAQAVKAAALTE
jgi:ketosteroid isomerase-like protein